MRVEKIDNEGLLVDLINTRNKANLKIPSVKRN